VLFDLDDTLFAHRAAVGSGILATLAANPELAGADATAEVARWEALEETHYHRYLAGELDFEGQRRARARAFLEPYGVALRTDADATAWWAGYWSRYTAAWALHDDTVPCLDDLEGRGIRLGLITNGDLASQTRKLEAVALTGRFEHVVASGALGIAKPDARIFLHTCERFAVAPAEIVYVGDRLRTDALGAVGAGLGGVWIDRRGVATRDELDAASAAGVPVIRSLAELPVLVSRTAG
jgi:putative hydrolase of the HAD superfamily